MSLDEPMFNEGAQRTALATDKGGQFDGRNLVGLFVSGGRLVCAAINKFGSSMS